MPICPPLPISILKLFRQLAFIVVAGLWSVWPTLLSADVLAGVLAGGLADYRQLSKTSHLVLDERGSVVSSLRANQALIPASTVKLVTAWLCLQHWGEQHRFTTSFYYDNASSVLTVKAGGDPFLISEEIAIIAENLVAAGINKVTAVRLQTDLYQPDLKVPGATTTDNPYDAVPSSLAANFNTVNVRVDGNSVTSAEPQTPLAPIAKTIGSALQRSGKYRVNTGQSSKYAEKYFAELLLALLKQHGVQVAKTIEWGAAPNTTPLYIHKNTRTLGEVIKGMLRYSTNFIANQLILTLVAERTGRPADFELVERYLASLLSSELQWSSFTLLEGAGLSPDNRLSAVQLVQVVEKFNRWRHLLPEIQPGFMAKTGTLTGVKTLAGYVTDDQGSELPFAVLINQPVDASMPAQVIKALVK